MKFIEWATWTMMLIYFMTAIVVCDILGAQEPLFYLGIPLGIFNICFIMDKTP